MAEKNYFGDIGEKEIEWLRLKWGMMSASLIVAITKTGRREMTSDELSARPKGVTVKTVETTFGEAALSYIHKIATERLTEFDVSEENFESRAMRRGKMNEPISFYNLESRLGLTGKGVLKYYGGDEPLFEKYSPYAGSSPDVLAIKNKKSSELVGNVSFGAELKNPDPKQHVYYLANMRTPEELKIVKPEYYAQVQFSMMTFKTNLWLWSSFNERMKNFADRQLIIEVPADKTYQLNLKMRHDMAVKETEAHIARIEARRSE